MSAAVADMTAAITAFEAMLTTLPEGAELPEEAVSALRRVAMKARERATVVRVQACLDCGAPTSTPSTRRCMLCNGRRRRLDPDAPGRTCRGCGRYRPAADFDRALRPADGALVLKPRCLECEGKTREGRRRPSSQSVRAGLPAAPPGQKVCFTCHVAKPLTAFWVHRESSDGRQGTCAECLRLRYRGPRGAARTPAPRACGDCGATTSYHAARRAASEGRPPRCLACSIVARRSNRPVIVERRCARCAEVKPVSEFYARKPRRPDGPVNYGAYCKPCHRVITGAAKKRQRALAPPAGNSGRARLPEMAERRCNTCGAVKPVAEYYAARRRDGTILPQSRCKACSNAASLRSYHRRMEKKKEAAHAG